MGRPQLVVDVIRRLSIQRHVRPRGVVVPPSGGRDWTEWRTDTNQNVFVSSIVAQPVATRYNGSSIDGQTLWLADKEINPWRPLFALQ